MQTLNLFITIWLMAGLTTVREKAEFVIDKDFVGFNTWNSNVMQQVFLPIVMKSPIPEVDYPGGRWPHTIGQLVDVPYTWSGDLTNPYHTWRPAFQSGINDWNSTTTLAYFHNDTGSSNTIEMFYDPNGPQGKTVIYFNPQTGVTSRVNAYGNLYWDIHWGYSNNQRQNVAEHEIGHMLSIGHIPRSYTNDALMVEWSTLEEMNMIFTPQTSDIALVNQVYR